jgi:hypothetical protein
MSAGPAVIVAETETNFARKGLPPLTDHAFMRMLRIQCNTTKPMTRIAAELGVDVDDLCAWIMAYKEPRKARPYENKGAGPIGEPKRPGNSWSPAAQARRQAAWLRQRDGAAATRRMLEAAGK